MLVAVEEDVELNETLDASTTANAMATMAGIAGARRTGPAFWSEVDVELFLWSLISDRERSFAGFILCRWVRRSANGLGLNRSLG